MNTKQLNKILKSEPVLFDVITDKNKYSELNTDKLQQIGEGLIQITLNHNEYCFVELRDVKEIIIRK